MSASINKKLKDWFTKYQAEQISREEFRELRQEVNNYTDEELFPVLLDSWNNSLNNKTLSPEDAQDLLLRIRRDIATSPAPEKKIRKLSWRQIAATIALFIMSSLSLYLYVDNRNITLLADRKMEVKVGKGERYRMEQP